MQAKLEGVTHIRGFVRGTQIGELRKMEGLENPGLAKGLRWD